MTVFIDKKNKIRECTRCHDRKDFKKFPLRLDGLPKSWCSPCTADYYYQSKMKKRIEEGKFTQKCPDCDRLFILTCRCKKHATAI